MQGQTINGYTLKHRLGEGGMAEVWYAENEIGKPAAVKILNENLSRNTQIVERFHNEALVMVKLDHPNIRQVYGYGYLGDRHCIIMEYLEGDDLEALLKKGRHFTNEELQCWWNHTVDALNYTHTMGVVHRDIKPSNIFLDKNGNIKLLDFGIAKVKESISMTRTGMMMGTLMYMSPEQVKDPKRVGPKSDVYSLAVTFVHLLTGKPVYDSDTSSEYDIQLSIVNQPVDLSSVDSAWQGFLASYLEKDPDKRPALRHFEEVDYVPPTEIPNVETKTMAESTTPVETTLQDKPKSKTGLWIGLGIAAVVIVALVLLLTGEDKSSDNGNYARSVSWDEAPTELTDVATTNYVEEPLETEDIPVEPKANVSFYCKGDSYEGVDLFAKVDGMDYHVDLSEAQDGFVKCFDIVEQKDFDGNGVMDALIEETPGCGNAGFYFYYIVSYHENGYFSISDEIQGISCSVENWKGQESIVVEDANVGINQDKKYTKKNRYVFKDGKMELVETMKLQPMVALKEINSFDFHDGKEESILKLEFDMDENGIMDYFEFYYWERWDSMLIQGFYLNGVKIQDCSMGMLRLGVLSSKTKGMHDLVIDENRIVKWDGEKYLFN